MFGIYQVSTLLAEQMRILYILSTPNPLEDFNPYLTKLDLNKHDKVSKLRAVSCDMVKSTWHFLCYSA